MKKKIITFIIILIIIGLGIITYLKFKPKESNTDKNTTSIKLADPTLT